MILKHKNKELILCKWWFLKFVAAKETCQQSNLDAESNRNLSRTRILPLDYQDLLELKQFMKKVVYENLVLSNGNFILITEVCHETHFW